MLRVARVAGMLSLTVFLSAGSRAVYARADTVSDVKAADTNIYQAIAGRDAARLADLLDNDFVLTNTFGEVYDKERFLAACCSGEAASKTLLLSATESQVKTYGNAAVVVARTEMRFTRDNETQEQKLSWRSLRVYVKSGGKWRLAAEQRTSIG